MNLLLNTHALIWRLGGDAALSFLAREAIGDTGNTVAVSAASAMEISTKFRLEKLAGAALLARDFEAIVRAQGFVELPITFRHAGAAGAMNIAHQDPFDRILIAQAQVQLTSTANCCALAGLREAAPAALPNAAPPAPAQPGLIEADEKSGAMVVADRD